MDTLESLRRKIEGATDIKSVVKTMKAVAASNIGQYEMAVGSLGDYYNNVAMGFVAYFKSEKINTSEEKKERSSNKEKLICAIVFGSDQGLVGQFNDTLTDFVSQSLKALPGKKEVWAVGERVQSLLSDTGLHITKSFPVPNSVNAITPLVGQILIKSEESREKEKVKEFYIFHNQPKLRVGYTPVMQRLLPLDEKWRHTFDKLKWPTKELPQVAGEIKSTLLTLIREYLFVSLFRACAESLSSENSSRLNAMQRAEKNIGELLDGLNDKFRRLRQSSIDEELFDVVSGSEALKIDNPHKIK
ncbi:MAG: F0F1 ATP synthase subunit gamma [Bacteroidia bacterium]